MAYTPLPTLSDDMIVGDDASDSINALAGNDSVSGGGGNDTLSGAEGNDWLDGGAGNDMLAGGEVMLGGAGDDTYLLDRYLGTGTVYENAVAGEANIVQVADGITASQVESHREGADLTLYVTGYQDSKIVVKDWFTAAVHPVSSVVFSDGTTWGASMLAAAAIGPPSDGNLSLAGTPGADLMEGRDGNDTIDGLGGANAILGAAGDDLLRGGADADMLDGGVGYDQLEGGAGNDLLMGRTGADTLSGGAGNDVLNGGAGNDLLLAGDGSNRADFHYRDGADIFVGTATDGTSQANTLNFDTFYFGSDIPDRGLVPADIELARFGNDLLVSVLNTRDSVLVRDYFAQQGAGLYPIAGIRFESGLTWSNTDIALHTLVAPPRDTINDDVFMGTEGDDVARTGSGNDMLRGAGGSDFLDGQLGDDTLDGGAGDDAMIVDSDRDVVVESADSGTDLVQSYIDYRLGANVENLTLLGDFAVVGEGNDADNRMNGNALDNVLWGLAGADTLDGAGGMDSLHGGMGNDLLLLHGAAMVDGGSGIDMAELAMARGSYAVQVAGARATVQASGALADTLVNVERLHFSDGYLAVDFSGGHAESVARIIGAVFGRDTLAQPDMVGIGLKYLDGGMALADLVQVAVDFRLGTSPTSGQVVDVLYANVVGSLPTQAEHDYYTGLLDSGGWTVSALAAYAMATPENADHIGLRALELTGIAYQPM